MGQMGLHALARRPAVRRRPRDPPHTASPSSCPNVRHSSSPTQPELVSQAGNGHPAKAHVSRRRTPCARTADSKGRQPKDGHRIAGTLCKEPNRTRQGEAPQLEGKPYVRRRLPRLTSPRRGNLPDACSTQLRSRSTWSSAGNGGTSSSRRLEQASTLRLRSRSAAFSTPSQVARVLLPALTRPWRGSLSNPTPSSMSPAWNGHF